MKKVLDDLEDFINEIRNDNIDVVCKRLVTNTKQGTMNNKPVILYSAQIQLTAYKHKTEDSPSKGLRKVRLAG